MANNAQIDKHVTLAENEHVIKRYDALHMISPYKLDISIALTNRRVLFYGDGISWFGMGENKIVSDVNIDKVTGTDIFKGRTFSIVQLIIGVLIGLGGLSYMLSSNNNNNMMSSGASSSNFGGGLFLLIIGIAIILFSFKTVFSIVVKAEHIDPISIGIGGYSITKPGNDADVVLKEIGAMILNIKNSGDKFTEKLKCPNKGCTYMRSIDEKPKHCPECGTEWMK